MTTLLTRPLSTATPSQTLTTIHNAAELPGIEQDWLELQARISDATVFSSWQWNAAVARHFVTPRALKLMLLEADGSPVAIAPLARRRVVGLRALAFLGTCLTSYSRADYQDFLVSEGHEDAAATAFVDELARDSSWEMLWLQELPASSRLLPLLPDLARREGWTVVVEPSSDVYRVALPNTWEQYIERLSPNTRSSIGRKTRKLEREHGAGFSRVASPTVLPQAMETLFILHESRWRPAGKSALLAKPTIFGDARTRAFHLDLARSLLDAGMLDLELLSADDTVVGARYSFVFNGTKSFYASGFRTDDEWSKHSLGLVMDAQSIHRSIDAGLDYEDFLRNDGAYKQHYAPERSDNVDLIVFTSKAAAARFQAYRGLRNAAKRLLQRWRPA